MQAFLTVFKNNNNIESVKMFNTQTFAKLFVDEAYDEHFKKATKEEQEKAKRYKNQPYFEITTKDGVIHRALAGPIKITDEKEDINPATENRKVYAVYVDTKDYFTCKATASKEKVDTLIKDLEKEGKPVVNEFTLIDLVVA